MEGTRLRNGVLSEFDRCFFHPGPSRNHQTIERNKGGDSPSLDAYRRKNSNRVRMQAAAAYGALQEQNIVYSVPPASFEEVGQRVRLCDAVIQQKMGTCLDLTLLYVAVSETIGLHSSLILINAPGGGVGTSTEKILIASSANTTEFGSVLENTEKQTIVFGLLKTAIKEFVFVGGFYPVAIHGCCIFYGIVCASHTT